MGMATYDDVAPVFSGVFHGAGMDLFGATNECLAAVFCNTGHRV
jgi:hypothetical protein